MIMKKKKNYFSFAALMMLAFSGLIACGVIDDNPVIPEPEPVPPTKYYIYGEDPVAQPSFVLKPFDQAAGRFSNYEGKYLPFLSDDIYFGLKTLIFEITDVQEGPAVWKENNEMGLTLRVMNGWWSNFYADNIEPQVGLLRIPITEEMAKECARGSGGEGKDLNLLMTQGSITIKSVYYEE